MFDFFAKLFTADFMPHGHCLAWEPGVLWLHVVADVLTGLSYYSIPLVLIYFVRRRKDLAFPSIVLMFGAFIFACGTTHLLDVLTTWVAVYRLEGVVKLITAGLSLATAIALVPLVPRALALPSQAQLQKINEELEREVAERRRIEKQLQEAQALAHIGSWEWEIAANHLTWSKELYNIYGVDPDRFAATYEGYLERLHPGDRDRVRETVERAYNTGEAFDFVHRIVRPDGEERVIHGQGRVVLDDVGRPQRMFGTGQDITENIRVETALKESEARFRAIAEVLPIPLTVVRLRDGQIVYANEEHARTMGLEPGQSIGRQTMEFYYDLADRKPLLEKLEREGQLQRYEVRLKKADGTPFWVLMSSRLLKFQGVTAALGAFYDITDRKEAEEALKERTRMLRTVIEASPQAIVALNEQNKIYLWNPAAERIFGWSADEVRGRELPIIPPGKRAEFRSFQEAVWQGKRVENIETWRRRKDGTRVDVSISVAPLYDAQGEVNGYMGIIVDIGERKRAEELQRTFSRRLLQAQEEERRRVARELHDGVSQLLAASRFRIEAVAEQMGQGGEGAVQRAVELLDAAIAEVRHISHGLRPSLLDDLGLEAAMRSLCEEFSLRTGIQVQHALGGMGGSLPGEMGTTLYRLLQEALNNVEKHAGARRVRVELSAEEKWLVLRVEDDGRGFDAHLARQEGRGMGLTNMRERVHLMGGHLELEAQPDRGTALAFRLPLGAGAEKVGGER